MLGTKGRNTGICFLNSVLAPSASFTPECLGVEHHLRINAAGDKVGFGEYRFKFDDFLRFPSSSLGKNYLLVHFCIRVDTMTP